MRKRTEEGFTLTEVVIVVALIAILSAVAIPSIQNWLPNMRLKGAARDLYSNMQKARMLAVKNNRNAAVIFDTANNTYSICNNWSGGACTGTLKTITLTEYKSGVKYGYGTATKQATVAVNPLPLNPDDNVSYNPPANVAVFNPDGLGTNGYAYLEHQEGTATYAIGSLNSGVIKLKKWQGGEWK